MKEFHVHVDASLTALGVVLAQLGEGDIDHLITFASRKLSSMEKNYTTTTREKDSPWSMCLKNLDIICWVDILKCTLIIRY